MGGRHPPACGSTQRDIGHAFKEEQEAQRSAGRPLSAGQDHHSRNRFMLQSPFQRPSCKTAACSERSDLKRSSVTGYLCGSRERFRSSPVRHTPTVPSNIPAPPHTNWSHRYKEAGQPTDYQLYGQIWVSNALAGRVSGAWIHRRKYLTEDGSDHDPAWIELTL